MEGTHHYFQIADYLQHKLNLIFPQDSILSILQLFLCFLNFLHEIFLDFPAELNKILSCALDLLPIHHKENIIHTRQLSFRAVEHSHHLFHESEIVFFVHRTVLEHLRMRFDLGP